MRSLNNRVAIFIGVAAILPVCALLGWTFDVEILKSVLPGLTPMNPLTAVCFLSSGLAIGLVNIYGERNRAAGILAGITLLLAGWVIAAWLWGLPFRPDGWMFAHKLELEARLNQMAPNTALAFCFVSLSLLTFRKRTTVGIRVAQGAGFAAGMLGAITLFDYALSLGRMASFGHALPMALSTAIGFILLAAAIFAARPGLGFVLPFYGSNPAAAFARKLLLASFLVPTLVTTITVHGERLGLYDPALGAATAAVVSILIFALLVWRTATVLKKTDDARSALHEGLELRAIELEAARREAERANEAKSHFLSRMSHELRTPMNAVIGYAQLLQMVSEDPKIVASSEAILKGGRHLLSLINEVLDLARIEAGKLALSVEAVAVSSVIAQAIELVRPTSEDRGITIELVAPPDEHVHVVADRQRLLQVLLNLLTNAAKYNRPNGTIHIECSQTADAYRIEVSDTGIGIPEEGLSRLFTPFERLGGDTVEGTGLGLALSQSLATLMGGSVSLVRTSPEGSTFAIELKKATAPQAQATIQRVASIKGLDQQLRIVYIEDNLSNLRLLESVFAEMGGVELLSAMQASVGLLLIEDHQPDVVLLDLHLPDAHGMDVLHNLKTNPRTAEIPIIVISADATDTQIRRLLDAGARSYLTKPIDLAALFDELREIKPIERKAA